MTFMPEGWKDGAHNTPPNPLNGVVRNLSVSAKKAMFAAAQKGLIRRKSWDGCAFNQAGEMVHSTVYSIDTAADTFDMSRNHVGNFIKAWDGLIGSDADCTRLLIQAIESSGLATPPNTNRRRVIRGYVYKSEATKFAEQLASGELTVDMIPGCEEVGKLLSSCAA